MQGERDAEVEVMEDGSDLIEVQDNDEPDKED